MFIKLQDYLKRPALYERTDEKFWTDPHIAKQMLAAHINPNTDGASRKPEFINRCSDWIQTLVPKRASVLDIGCGPGLYTKQFAKRGLKVTGLDFSENSIAYAREYDPNSEYIVGNYLEMEFANTFDIITLIYYDYGALIPVERQNLLRRVHKALKPNGLFLFDVYTVLKGRGRRDSTTWSVNPTGGFMSAEPHICLEGEYIYGEIAEGCRTVIIGENGVRCYNLWDCYFTKQTLLEEAAPFGFAEYGFYNDATGTPYTDDSQTLCAILKKIGD